MTLGELQRRLNAAGVLRTHYKICRWPWDSWGSHEDMLTLECGPRGRAVFYTERGKKTQSQIYTCKSDACRDMYDRLISQRR